VERVHDLVPFVHVLEPERSVEFYRRLGLEPINSVSDGDRLQWAFLRNEHACLMVARASGAIDREQQAILLYLYVRDLEALRGQLLDDGIEAGQIEYPTHMPAGELRLEDPDGYVLLVGQLPDPQHRR
jgi:catechol 2,3-dioxygenase-like lactoylglutathione lyase family enzyme